MSVEKWRRRGVFGNSVGAVDRSAAQPNGKYMGWLVKNGTMSPTTDGTSNVMGTQVVDLSGNGGTQAQLMIPFGTGATSSIGTVHFGTTNGLLRNGLIKVGINNGSAELGFTVGGSVFVFRGSTATGGAAGSMICVSGPAGTI